MNPINTDITLSDLQNKKLEGFDKFFNSNISDKKDEALKKAASDFEAVFVKQFIETMESTVQKTNFLEVPLFNYRVNYLIYTNICP